MRPAPGPCCDSNRLALTKASKKLKPNVQHMGKTSGNPKSSSFDEETFQADGKGGYIPLPKSQEEDKIELICHEQERSRVVVTFHLNVPDNPDSRILLRDTLCPLYSSSSGQVTRTSPKCKLNVWLSHLLLLLMLKMTKAFSKASQRTGCLLSPLH